MLEPTLCNRDGGGGGGGVGLGCVLEPTWRKRRKHRQSYDQGEFCAYVPLY